MQRRLVFSLLKPAVRAAARFGLPIRELVELVRAALYEELAREGLTQSEIAARFGQTPRHMRSLARLLASDFFRAEREVGLVREVEAVVAARTPSERELAAALPTWSRAEVSEAVAILLDEGRIERVGDGRLATARRYVVLRSDGFHRRIDSLNHFLDGAYRAVLHRLVFDEQDLAMTKAISFSAIGSELAAFVKRLEGELRREIASLDERATFAGRAEERYTLSLGLAPVQESRPVDQPSPPKPKK
jgi:hypothetical protein